MMDLQTGAQPSFLFTIVSLRYSPLAFAFLRFLLIGPGTGIASLGCRIVCLFWVSASLTAICSFEDVGLLGSLTDLDEFGIAAEAPSPRFELLEIDTVSKGRR